jgi:serine/threonine protein kinase
LTPPRDGRFGNYQLVETIAQGGMGTIYLAKRVGVGGFEKNFVIKCMLESLAGDPELEKMFINEARLAARLSHPNIAQIYDFGVIDGSYYIAMEHVLGEDLKTIIQQLEGRHRQMPVPIALRIMIDLCAGLEYAHTLSDGGVPLGIIHRDVSPANVMVSYQGAVKLLDFGIAKAAMRTSATRAGNVKGKHAFIAPEQIEGQALDARADVFCAGLVMSMLLLQRHPFWRGTGFATMQAIADEKPADPRLQRADLPEDVAAIMVRALESDRQRRFASAAEMGRALTRALERMGPTDQNLILFMADLFSGKPEGEGRIILPPAAHMTPTQAMPDRPSRQMRQVLDHDGEPEPTAPPQTLGPPPVPARPARRRLQLAGAGGAALVVVLLIAHLVSGRRAAVPVQAARPIEILSAPLEVPVQPAQIMEPAALAEPEDDGAAGDDDEALDDRPTGRSATGRAALVERRRLKSAIKTARPRLAACVRRHAADLPAKSRSVKVGLVLGGSGKVLSVKSNGSPAMVTCLEDAAGRLRFPRNVQHKIGLAFPLTRKARR